MEKTSGSSLMRPPALHCADSGGNQPGIATIDTLLLCACLEDEDAPIHLCLLLCSFAGPETSSSEGARASSPTRLA